MKRFRFGDSRSSVIIEEIAMKISTILKVIIVVAVFGIVFTHSLSLPDPEGVLGNSSTKIFHTLDCKNLRTGSEPEDTQMLFFANRDRAIEAGYKPCEICEP